MLGWLLNRGIESREGLVVQTVGFVALALQTRQVVGTAPLSHDFACHVRAVSCWFQKSITEGGRPISCKMRCVSAPPVE